MPFFSVIIPTYNRLPYLLEALDSVWRQSFTDYEVIVVDDGSTDGTQTAVLEMLKSGNAERVLAGAGREDCHRQPGGQDDRERTSQILKLKYLNQENAGPGAARNAGIWAARGEYVAFLDSDDLWFPWTLETYSKAIRSSDEVSFVAGREIKAAADDKLDEILKNFPDWNPKKNFGSRYFDNYLESSSERIWIGTPAACIRRACLEEVGGFLEERINAEDSDMWLRMGVEKGFVRIEEPAVFIHRITPGSEIASSAKAIAGMKNLLISENAGEYPGGLRYLKNRQQILSRHLRPGCVGLARAGNALEAWSLYIETFWMHLRLRAWKFLIGLPTLLLKKLFQQNSQ